MKKFWNWKTRTVTNQETQEQVQERTLFLNWTSRRQNLMILARYSATHRGAIRNTPSTHGR